MRHYPNVAVEKHRGGKPTWWQVLEPVQCYDKDGSRYIIPAGFVSNFASSPAWSWPILAPHGQSAIPSVKHDYRYVQLIGIERQGYAQARLSADRQFRADLLAEGLVPWKAHAMYLGVRALGWLWWWRHMRRRLLELSRAT